MRTVALRLARSTGGGVEYWLSLPIYELLEYLIELGEQLREENEEAEKASKAR